jgi:hypothetical protein
MEVWKDVSGFEGQYQVSNLGNVKSLFSNKEKLLSPGLDGRGYLKINFCNSGSQKSKKIHRLVALIFVPNPLNKPQVNHINGIKTDNRAENLEWVTNSENMDHAVTNKLVDNRGIRNKNSKLTEQQVHEIKYKSSHLTKIQLSKIYNVSRELISMIQNNKLWKHV